MKICVCFDGRVRPDSTGFYYVNAAKQLGHDVDHLLPEQVNNLAGGYDIYIRVDDGLGYHKWPAHLKPSTYVAIDTHIETDWREKLARDGQFDFIDSTHTIGLNLDWGCPSKWVAVGCDPEIHYQGLRQKKYDVCFIGNFHSQFALKRMVAVEALFAAFPNFYFGNRTYKEMIEKYAESKIVFNCSLNQDVNMRVFESMCSGSCLVTDRLPDLDALGFVDGVHYAGYSSKEEMVEVVKDLLVNDSKREEIARNGRSEVLKKHTYAHRLQTILQHLTSNKGQGELCRS